MLKKILITDGVHDVLIDGLKKLGFQITYLPDYNPDNLAGEIHEYH